MRGKANWPSNNSSEEAKSKRPWDNHNSRWEVSSHDEKASSSKGGVPQPSSTPSIASSSRSWVPQPTPTPPKAKSKGDSKGGKEAKERQKGGSSTSHGYSRNNNDFPSPERVVRRDEGTKRFQAETRDVRNRERVAEKQNIPFVQLVPATLANQQTTVSPRVLYASRPKSPPVAKSKAKSGPAAKRQVTI